MSQQDISDLAAYIKVLGTTKTVGITDTSIHIGWLPLIQEKFAKVDAVQQQITKAFFQDLNQKGGIYNRKIYLKNYQEKNNNESLDLFALTGSALFANQTNSTNNFDIGTTPFIGPISTYPTQNDWQKATTFYAYPNLKEQIELFATKLATTTGIQKSLAILVANTPLQQALAQPFKQAASFYLVKEIAPKTSDFTIIIEELKKSGIQSVLLLGNPELEAHFFQHFSTTVPPFDIILPSTQTQQSIFELPPTFNNKIVLLYPFWNNVVSPQGRESFQQLQQKYQLSIQYQQSQMLALSTATLIVEAIKACGQDLTPATLVEQLERFYKLKTQWSPSMTFTPNRHTGVEQIFVLRYQGKAGGFVLEK